jgi:hypothetical protein
MRIVQMAHPTQCAWVNPTWPSRVIHAGIISSRCSWRGGRVNRLLQLGAAEVDEKPCGCGNISGEGETFDAAATVTVLHAEGIGRISVDSSRCAPPLSASPLPRLHPQSLSR